MNLTLYHSVESTCSHKVRIVLTEKGLDWAEHLVNLRKGEQFSPDYLSLNPKAVVPTLIHDGKVVRESSIINEYLDEVFPEPPLKSSDPAERAAMRLWVKTFDDEVHPSIGIITYGVVLRHQMNKLKSAGELEAHFAAMPDAARRERQQSVHQLGVEAPQFRAAVAQLDVILEQIDKQLKVTNWLSGNQYSLSDACATPYIMRLLALQFQPMVVSRPALRAWHEKSMARMSSKKLAERQAPQSLLALYKEYGQSTWPKVKEMLKAAEQPRQ